MRKNTQGGCRWNRACVAFLLCAATAIAASGQTFQTLHTGDGGPSPLVEGFDGKLYGGYAQEIFKIGVYGAFTGICPIAKECNVGYSLGPLNLGQDGNLYGTAFGGGNNGGGTVFRATPKGVATALYNFCEFNRCPGGDEPEIAVPAPDGNLYGITYQFGLYNRGTAFKINSQKQFKVIYRFCAVRTTECLDGSLPNSLIVGTDGNLYGTTEQGGEGNFSCGTVFKLTPGGVLTTLYSFCNPGTDASPSHLIQASDGNFYGTTQGGFGSIFKITPEGMLTTLYRFCTQSLTLCTGGWMPTGLTQGTDGNFYGATCNGGTAAAPGDGTLYKITPDGILTTLYSFTGPNISCPQGLVQATNGKFYGTTPGNNGGFPATIFVLDVGLRPFVKTVLTSGKVGARVTIIGRNLSDVSAISFNGAPATFTLCSSGTAMDTSVPEGATSGPVTVTTPTGTLTSNIVFTVLP